MINIRVSPETRSIVLEIADNGIGREAAGRTGRESSGKGMKIMDQFYDLYEKITGNIIYSRNYRSLHHRRRTGGDISEDHHPFA